ncbi:hypothetical protein FAI41_00835 [Acetobacteraceae bacterium]|nr:hypothetical protein FAI41_00835 [Acetobacteraceae bacterium]
MFIKQTIFCFLILFLWMQQAHAQMVLSSPWDFGKRQVQGLSIPFLSWRGQDNTIKASVQIYRAPPSVIKEGDGMVIALTQGTFQCDGVPLTVAMMDGKLFEFPTDTACKQGVIELHSTQEQAKEIWQEIQKGSLPSGIRQNSHYLVLQSTETQGLSAFQNENKLNIAETENPNQEKIFSSKWVFRATKVKSGSFPTLAYEAITETSRVVVQIFRMPQSLSQNPGDIMIVMVPESESFKCSGETLRVTMSDHSFFDLKTTGKCVQGMVEAHSTEAQEPELWKKIQSGILPQNIGTGEKAYFKLLAKEDGSLWHFQQSNQQENAVSR